MSSLTGALIRNGSQLVGVNKLSSYTSTAGLTTLLAGKVSNSRAQTNLPASALSSDTVYAHPSSHPILMITSLQSALDETQAMLSAVAGCFLNGSTISSYTLRWNGSSMPSNPNVIQEVHWSNYTVAQTINIGTGNAG